MRVEASSSETNSGLLVGADGLHRCAWQRGLPDYQAYHDHEWGRPVADDRKLFEKVCLEGFQSGLSWLTVLRKREHFRRAFADFDPERIARFDQTDIERLLADRGIIRHRGKITATINNASRALELRAEAGSLARYFWRFEPRPSARPKRFDGNTLAAIAETSASRALSADLRRRGWRFVGPTTMYALMQAMGLVNDHVQGCTIRERVAAERAQFQVPQ